MKAMTKLGAELHDSFTRTVAAQNAIGVEYRRRFRQTQRALAAVVLTAVVLLAVLVVGGSSILMRVNSAIGRLENQVEQIKSIPSEPGLKQPTRFQAVVLVKTGPTDGTKGGGESVVAVINKKTGKWTNYHVHHPRAIQLSIARVVGESLAMDESVLPLQFLYQIDASFVLRERSESPLGGSTP
jgi:hypothetical protein